MSVERTLPYQPALDGLRGVAVLLVFVFHAAPGILPGGFIGVDVFFVLSGYLITSVLIAQLNDQKPGLLRDFFVRRIRRLLPASLVLIAAVAIWESLFGSVLSSGTRHQEIRSTLLYIANWNFIGQADDYFAEGSVSPLRHMWSLAVEEQFYIFWPFAIFILWKIGARRATTLTVTFSLIVASAVLMYVMYSPVNTSRVYYGTDTRIFQPLIGAALAFLLATRTPQRKEPKGLTAAGFTAVLLLFGFSRWMPDSLTMYFKGGAILIALATTVIIVAVAKASPLSKLLSARPIVHIGVISYGIYLWHFPITLWLSAPTDASFFDRRLTNLLQLLLTIALAEASFRLVEQPIRASISISRRTVSGVALTSVFSLFIISSALLAAPSDSLIAEATADRSYDPCPSNPQPCLKVEGARPESKTVVIVGDSTSQAYDPALKVLAAKHGFRYVHAAVGGCPIGHRFLATGISGELHKQSNYVCFEESPGIYVKVLEEWDADLIIETWSNEPNQHVTDGALIRSQTDLHLSETKEALIDAVSVLSSRGAELVFLHILPPGPDVNCLSNDSPNTGSCVREVPRTSREIKYNRIFDEIALSHEQVIGTISFSDIVCPNWECPLMINGIVARYDGGHFTGTMSEYLSSFLDRRLSNLGVELSSFS